MTFFLSTTLSPTRARLTTTRSFCPAASRTRTSCGPSLAAVSFVAAMVSAGKPVAVICHGPWTLVEADLVRGRTLTSWPSLQTDIRNAGGTWVDTEVQTCTSGPNVLVTSRKPDDLPAFCNELVRQFQAAGPAAS